MALRILLLTGIREELHPLLNSYSLQFNKELRLYRSLRYPELYAATTGPHLKRRRELRRWIDTIQPRIVVNAGLVGLLELGHPASIGDRISLELLVDAKTAIQYPGGPGKARLVSIDRPVFAPHEKMDLALDYKADVCDMEAAVLTGFLGQFDKLSERMTLIFCKVVGDRPESWNLFRYEHLVRGWEGRGLLSKARAGLLFPGGPWKLKKLLHRKELGRRSLCGHVSRLLDSLIEHQGISRSIDSVFIPH